MSLLHEDRAFLILEADDVDIKPARLEAATKLLVAAGFERPESVASVLMPISVLKSNGSLAEKLNRGVSTFSRWRRISKAPISGWTHSYYERLVGVMGKRNGQTKQLGLDHISHIVEKMNSWKKDVRAGIYAHTNLPSDRLRVRGAPCLQYIQIELHDGAEFTLNALYRSHDYGNKCLGNLIGLCRLGALLSDHTGRKFSRLRIISMNPFLPSGNKKALETLVDELA
jgi:thymidylate synthase